MYCMLRVAVVEDELAYCEQLENFLHRYAEENSMQIEVFVFTSALPLTKRYQPVYDIVLLDIKMPDMDGMEAAGIIRRIDSQVVLMFITQMAQYAINGYEVGALDFVLKPVGYDTFAMKFTRAVQRAENRSGHRITLNLPGGIRCLWTRDIYYVEIQNHMLHYYTSEGEFILRGTMQGAEQELKPYGFAKCNHWYLVNLNYVSEIRKNSVMIAGRELEISRRNRASFLAEATNYLGGYT